MNKFFIFLSLYIVVFILYGFVLKPPRLIYNQENLVNINHINKKHIDGMTIDDIPEDFKIKIKNYILKLKLTIIEKDNYTIINGTKCPKNLVTQHNKLILGCDDHIDLMIEIFFLLYIFHEYCESNNIIYSITYGNLIGYYRENDMLLWDDDVDLLLMGDKSQIINKLWNDSSEEFPIWDNNWTYKNIKLGSYNIILVKMKTMENFFKIKLNNIIKDYYKDFGGIDITFLINNIHFGNIDLSILNNYEVNNENYPIIKYGPIYTRAFSQNIGTQLLDSYYGKNWNERIHPELKYELG